MAIENNDTKEQIDRNVLNPDHWVHAYADYLYKYALVRVRDEDIAQDLIQDTFLAALKGVTKFEGKSSERTWLTGILKHKIVDYYRKSASGLNHVDSVSTSEENTERFFNESDGHWKKEYAPQPFAEIIDSINEREFNLILQKCMQKLPKLWAAVFSLKHIDEEETDVILSSLSISSSNFWVIIHRTKLSLRSCLQKNWL
ncbi:sigma-70 family RNA polymerase sigma factor [Pedobacter sandarakinus]|uniref:sigma-70 family RNA polymerase sigma factor n=1 Tax=Pedobacter sandarakinus TaxID=353156 RepID=UPI00224533E0|nr:sigma-70 family RNA polymerase sigma factor [Pedobacter sandarakinus]MCX2575608.1 sigma-70 family RNA polymerase sigma factor [Pedobacter sandarakinus]